MKTDERLKPTPAELAILRVLWQKGACTVQQVHEALGGSQRYTTVLKQLQIMSEKGLVVPDKAQRSHIYQAGFQEEQTQRQLVGDLVDRAFGGSATRLVMQALSARPASPEELAEIRLMINKFEEKTR
jgi:predicted transcriptional regulator